MIRHVFFTIAMAFKRPWTRARAGLLMQRAQRVAAAEAAQRHADRVEGLTTRALPLSWLSGDALVVIQVR